MLPFFNQIPTWLLHQELWRFVGFVSTILGLLCYALSSSFHHLFGNWYFAKLFAYIVLSIIISLATLFPKVWQHSPSNCFRVHMAFFVLTITSVYSFFLDRAVNGKPDAYSIVSWVAFAIMTLSLSRQIHYGFEGELLYFFLGALIVQLMKSKIWLVVVGVLFSYLLVILRSSLAAARENDYRLLLDPNPVVVQVDSDQSNVPSEDENVERQDQHFLANQVGSEQSNSSTDGILQEFKYTLRKLDEGHLKVSSELFLHLYGYLTKDNVHHIPSALVNDQNMLVDQLPLEGINDSHKKVGLMIAGGLENQCSEEYSIWRRESLKAICISLWLETGLKWIWQGFLENDSDLVEQSHMIKSWIKRSNICMRLLFPYERRLCDRVFSGFSSVSDISFTKVCSEMTSNILNFAKVWADDRYSRPMNETVQVFETLHGLIPEFESLFSDEYSSALRNEATTIRNALGEAISDYYMKELESVDHMIRQICHDIEHESVLGGIHPITVKVMDRLHDIGKARGTLEIVFRYFSKVPIRDGVSLLSVDMAKIIELLQTHLEKRSKSFDSNALGYVFLMNNQRYAVQKVQGSRLGKILGDDWIQRQMKKVRRHLKDYQRSSWDEVLDLLKLEKEEESMAPGQAALSMLEKLELFNILFEEICRIQSQWFALVDLRMEVITGVENILLPAYGNFIGRFQNILGNRAYKYIKFGIHDIKAQLNHIFLGGKERDQ